MKTLLRIVPVVLIAVIATDAAALRHNERPNWYFGIGYGIGRGAIENKSLSDGSINEEAYRNGASPHIRFGRMFGQHFSVGAYWESWLIEFDLATAAPGVVAPETEKLRRTLQNLALGLTWYPGNPLNATGGIFLRGGVGMGWAGTGIKEAAEEEKQEKGERLDEWGIAAFGEAGYEFWVSNTVTVGLAATYNYFSIEADFVQTAQFGAGVMHINLYF